MLHRSLQRSVPWGRRLEAEKRAKIKEQLQKYWQAREEEDLNVSAQRQREREEMEKEAEQRRLKHLEDQKRRLMSWRLQSVYDTSNSTDTQVQQRRRKPRLQEEAAPHAGIANVLGKAAGSTIAAAKSGRLQPIVGSQMKDLFPQPGVANGDDAVKSTPEISTS